MPPSPVAESHRHQSAALFFFMTTINQFASVVEKDLAEISGALKDINTRLHNIELREASCSPMLGSRLDAIRFRIDAPCTIGAVPIPASLEKAALLAPITITAPTAPPMAASPVKDRKSVV